MKILDSINNMVLKRLLSAFFSLALFIPIIVFLGKYSVYALSLLLMLFCAYEIFCMFFEKQKELKIFGTILAVFIFLTRVFFAESSVVSLTMLVFCIYFFIIAAKYKDIFYPEKNYALSKFFIYFLICFFAVIYLSIFISYIPMIRNFENGIYLFFLHIGLVWAGDSGAFFIGRKFGKKKLYPLLSPGKTIEGSLGGLIFSLIVALIFKFTFLKELGIIDAVSIGILVGTISQLGDLFESFIKRSANAKDSGSFLPGHGGFFDRFDGVIFSAPFFYYYIKLFF